MTEISSRPRGDRDAPRLSVVIPAHDAATTIVEQLDALANQEWDQEWEIVVVDNASTDETRRLCERAAPNGGRLRVIDASGGRGPAYARNFGAAAARGRSLAFCDADDVVAPGWVAAMGTALSDDEFVCGPVELERLNPPWLADSRGTTGTVGPPSFEGRFPFTSSCNLGIRRDRFLEVGGFDERLTVGEDIELSMRLSLGGTPLRFVPDATVHYRYPPTLAATFHRAVAYGAARPVLAERWRGAGGAPVSRWRGGRNWAWLVRHVLLVRTRAGRAKWLWVAGQRLGSVRGSWRVRRLYL